MILCCSKNCTFLIFKVVLLDFHFNAILVVIENAPFYLSYQPNSSIQSILKIQFLQTNFLVLHCRVKASVFGMRDGEEQEKQVEQFCIHILAFATLGPFSSPTKRKDLENSDRHFDDATRMCNLTATEINSSITSDKRNLAQKPLGYFCWQTMNKSTT